MPVPFPGPDDLDLDPPNAAETARSAAGVLSAARPRAATPSSSSC